MSGRGSAEDHDRRENPQTTTNENAEENEQDELYLRYGIRTQSPGTNTGANTHSLASNHSYGGLSNFNNDSSLTSNVGVANLSRNLTTRTALDARARQHHDPTLAVMPNPPALQDQIGLPPIPLEAFGPEASLSEIIRAQIAEFTRQHNNCNCCLHGPTRHQTTDGLSSQHATSPSATSDNGTPNASRDISSILASMQVPDEVIDEEIRQFALALGSHLGQSSTAGTRHHSDPMDIANGRTMGPPSSQSSMAGTHSGFNIDSNANDTSMGPPSGLGPPSRSQSSLQIPAVPNSLGHNMNTQPLQCRFCYNYFFSAQHMSISNFICQICGNQN